MSYCPKCGTQISDDSLFCANCGNRIVNPQQSANNAQYQAQQNYYNNPPQPIDPPSKQLSTGLLVWSIINIIVNFIFGILGLVFTLLAKDASTGSDEKSYLKTAKILNIVGTVLAVVAVVLTILNSILFLGIFGSILSMLADTMSTI